MFSYNSKIAGRYLHDKFQTQCHHVGMDVKILCHGSYIMRVIINIIYELTVTVCLLASNVYRDENTVM